MHKEIRAGLSKREASLPGKGLEMSCEADPTQGRRKRCFKQGNVLSKAQEAGCMQTGRTDHLCSSAFSLLVASIRLSCSLGNREQDPSSRSCLCHSCPEDSSDETCLRFCGSSLQGQGSTPPPVVVRLCEAGDLLVVFFFLAPLSFLPGFLFLMETVTREWAAESPWSRGGGRLWLVLSHRRSGGGGIRAVPPPPWLAHCPTQAFFLLAQPSPGNR